MVLVKIRDWIQKKTEELLKASWKSSFDERCMIVGPKGRARAQNINPQYVQAIGPLELFIFIGILGIFVGILVAHPMGAVVVFGGMVFIDIPLLILALAFLPLGVFCVYFGTIGIIKYKRVRLAFLASICIGILSVLEAYKLGLYYYIMGIPAQLLALVALSALFVSSAYVFILGFRKLRLKRLIQDMPTSKIHALAMGLVEIKGKVVPDKLLTSPFSGTHCVYYEIWLFHKSFIGNQIVEHEPVYHSEAVPFYIQDSTGKVLIDPAGSGKIIEPSLELCNVGPRKVSQRVFEYLREKNLPGGNAYTIIEKLITPKMALYVLGTAGRNPRVLQGMAKKSVEAVMIQKGKSDFFISTKLEKILERTQHRRAKYMVLAGALGMVLSLALLL